MTTDAPTLLSQAGCYDCYASAPGTAMLLKLALLRQILLANNANAVTDPETLLSQASCFACYASSPGTMGLLELALLAQIVNNGGGGGGGGAVNQIIAGAGIGVAPAGGTGNVTVSNTGVTKATAGSGITVAPGGGTGNVTISATAPTVFTATGTLFSTNPINAAHGLGSTPAKIRAVLLCVVAVEANTGYVLGDEIDISLVFNTGNVTPAFSYGANATNVWVYFDEILIGNEANYLVVPSGGGAPNNVLAWSSFQIKIYASL